MTGFKENMLALMDTQETLGVSETATHASAFALYEQHNYAEAAKLFALLVLQDPFSVDYWQGLASSYQMSSAYDKALSAWSLVALLDPADASCPFHAAECLVAQGEYDEALRALSEALRLRPQPHLTQAILKLQGFLNG